MTPTEKYYTKKVTEYEYNIIKNQLRQNKLSSNNRFFSHSKNGKKFPNQSTMYSSWKIHQKLELIRAHESQQIGKPKFLNNFKTLNGSQNHGLTWVGCSNISLSHALLYIFLNPLRPLQTRRVSEQKSILFKNFLYCLAQQSFCEEEKQKLVEGLCLLRSFEGCLSEFFLKHPSFENCCLKILGFLNSGKNVLQPFDIEKLASKLNNLGEPEITKTFTSKTEIIKADILYQGEYQRDFVIKTVLHEELISYIICQKGCVFIYENPELLKQASLKNDKKKLFLRQTIQPSKMHENSQDLLSVRGTLHYNDMPRLISEESMMRDSSNEKNTSVTKNSSMLVPNLPQSFDKSVKDKKFPHPTNFKGRTLNSIWRHKSQEDLESINCSLAQRNFLSMEADQNQHSINKKFENIKEDEEINEKLLFSKHDNKNEEALLFRPESTKIRNIPAFLKPKSKFLNEDSRHTLAKIASMKHIETIKNMTAFSPKKKERHYQRSISPKLRSPNNSPRLNF